MSRGFTLLEVVIALAILAVSLMVLLQSQAGSLQSAARSRDMTVATLLARSKMIDIEQHLFHDGFQMSTENEQGNFADVGHPEISWSWRILEVELDLSALTSFCDVMNKAVPQKDGENSCEGMMSLINNMTGSFTTELARSMRLVDLLLTWHEGKYPQTLGLRALLTRDDFTTMQESDLKNKQDQLQPYLPTAPPNPSTPGGS